MSAMKLFRLQVFGCLLFLSALHCQAAWRRFSFVVREASYTRLCSTKNILTINGQFPGPPLYVGLRETFIVNVYNRGDQNITLHWHGVKLPRYPWSDGPEYITQCPIQPGKKFSQKVILSNEEGTLLYHAHSEFSRATVHGAIVIRPPLSRGYPFPAPAAEFPIVLGEWWKADIKQMYDLMVSTGGDFNISDAYLINGQPGDLYPCSSNDTYRLTVERGKTYMLRIINAALSDILFFAVANHKLTVVGSDASYTRPLPTDYITISPGQTVDALLDANQTANHYYMAARVYTGNSSVGFDNTTTTAILQYSGNYTPSSPPPLPNLPYFNDTVAAFNFTGSLKSLANINHPVGVVPKTVDVNLFYAISINTIPCPANQTCAGPSGNILAASVNNRSFENPTISILQAYYQQINGVFGTNFPSFPPLLFNFTGQNLPAYLVTTGRATEVRVLEYNSSVEIVLQGTSLISGIDHPMHLHGYSFYVVGSGRGNFNRSRDPLNYNLIDPPHQNTIAVPVTGWTAIRFKATNPGVWFMHCHIDRHMQWGMDAVFIVKDGNTPQTKMRPPPPDYPTC